MATAFNKVYRYLQRAAHEQPTYFYSIIIGSIGPIGLVTIPPIRTKYFGWKRAEVIPSSFPVPDRPRRPVHGYEDEE